MKKLIIRLFYGFLLLSLLLISLFAFLLLTTPGLHTAIKLSAFFIPGTLKVNTVDGRLLDQFSLGEVSYQDKYVNLKIYNLHINWELTELQNFHLSIKQLKAEKLEITQATSLLTFENLQLSAEINKHYIKIPSLFFTYSNQLISGSLSTTTSFPYALTGIIKLNAGSKSAAILSGIVNIESDLTKVHWTGTLKGPMKLQLQLEGNLNQLLELDSTVRWYNLNGDLKDKNYFYSPAGLVHVSGTLPKLSIDINSKVHSSSQGNWQLGANIQGVLPWAWNFEANLAQTLNPASGHPGLYSHITAKGKLKDAKHGALFVHIGPGFYQMPKEQSVSLLRFQGGFLNTSLSPKSLLSQGSLVLDAHKKLNFSLKLPKFDLSKGLKNNQPLLANCALSIDSFEFLKELSPYITNPKGHLIAFLKASGTVSKFIIESKIALQQASLSIPELGLVLQNIELTALGKKNHWQAQGSLLSAGNKLILAGQGSLDATPTGIISLHALDFPIVHTKEYQINISPELAINFDSKQAHIVGKIVVPFARLHPQNFSNSITLPEDVIFKSQKEAPPAPSSLNTTMNVKVEMGSDVQLLAKGLQASLIGSAKLKQIAGGPINTTGELFVKQGKYQAYGQDLTIEQGQLIFTGGRIENPGINLRAAKTIDTSTTVNTNSFDFNNANLQNANLRGNISVGVEVSGRLTNPKITFFSNPAILSQADIFSMLILGRTADQASQAGGQLLLAALNSTDLGNGSTGNQLIQQLNKKLGFDFNVASTSNYNLNTNQTSNNTALVVGKSLSKKIYVSYNVGFSASDPNLFTLKYLLNKFYSIQLSGSTKESGIDILYSSNKG